MIMPGRKFSTGLYRYGFNGKENDNEVKGEGNQQDYGMRIYDPRLGRFLSVDPLTKDYPWYTPYQFGGNNPVLSIDIDGMEPDKNVNETETTSPGPPTKPVQLWGNDEKNKEFKNRDTYKDYVKKLTPEEDLHLIDGKYVFVRNEWTGTTYWYQENNQWVKFIPTNYSYPVSENLLKEIFWDGILEPLSPFKEADLYISGQIKFKTDELTPTKNFSTTGTLTLLGGQIGVTSQDDKGVYGNLVVLGPSYGSVKYGIYELRGAPLNGMAKYSFFGEQPKYGDFAPQLRHLTTVYVYNGVEIQADIAKGFFSNPSDTYLEFPYKIYSGNKLS